jgi:hypothetical protein
LAGLVSNVNCLGLAMEPFFFESNGGLAMRDEELINDLLRRMN